jgi:hypothetical protein
MGESGGDRRGGGTDLPVRGRRHVPDVAGVAEMKMILLIVGAVWMLLGLLVWVFVASGTKGDD